MGHGIFLFKGFMIYFNFGLFFCNGIGGLVRSLLSLYSNRFLNVLKYFRWFRVVVKGRSSRAFNFLGKFLGISLRKRLYSMRREGATLNLWFIFRIYSRS